MNLCIFTCICEQDAGWLPLYFSEIERLDVPFGIHFDRCSKETKETVKKHPCCVATTEYNRPRREFKETDKQRIFDIIKSRGYEWAWNMDIDETWETDILSKLPDILKHTRTLAIQSEYLTLWDDPHTHRIDTGIPHSFQRAKLYHLPNHSHTWNSPVVNGPRIDTKKLRSDCFESDMICLHWGMMTLRLRQMHKERWDRIYTKAAGKNPYGYWNFFFEPEYKVRTASHPYNAHISQHIIDQLEPIK